MADTEALLPIYQKNGMKGDQKTIFCVMQIPFFKFGCATITCSFLSFVFCIIWSILYNFEEANATHCSVENYLPSLSAATGHFYPQIYVWNSTIFLQFFPRLKISTMYLHYYTMIIYDKYSNLYNLLWFLNVYELGSLLGLSFITSTTNYSIHAFCFVSFLFSSMFYMILTCYLLKFRRKIPPKDSESRTLKWKFKCCLCHIFCFVMAGYFFRRHNAYCEPKVYSIFAMFEYGIVLSNMLFHLFAIWDFKDKTLVVALSSNGLEFNYRPSFKSLVYEIK